MNTLSSLFKSKAIVIFFLAALVTTASLSTHAYAIVTCNGGCGNETGPSPSPSPAASPASSSNSSPTYTSTLNCNANPSGTAASGCADQVDVGPLPNSDSGTSDIGSSFISTALSILFGVLGAICFLIVTIAGFRYVISRGEPEAISRSKDTILYALIGLVICIAAETIVSFVVGRL